MTRFGATNVADSKSARPNVSVNFLVQSVFSQNSPSPSVSDSGHNFASQAWDEHEVSVKDTVAHRQDNSADENTCEGEAQETTELSSGPVIELHDLTTGPEAEINRLKSNMLTLLEEMNQIRRQHAGLLADHQKLTGELREIKLVLAKVHAKELSSIERQKAWREWLSKFSDFFQKVSAQGTVKAAAGEIQSHSGNSQSRR
jgi:hypothetical protein